MNTNDEPTFIEPEDQFDRADYEYELHRDNNLILELEGKDFIQPE